MRYKLSILFILSTCFLLAQKEVQHKVNFHTKYGNSYLPNDTFFSLNTNDSIQIETLKFYISIIKLYHNNKLIWREKNSYHLIDISNSKSLTIDFILPSKMEYDSITFNMGIDSITNVAGVFGGDLDPTKGMYWTWQSGYINFKLEGKSNVCKTRNNNFQFHLGGYQNPFNGLQEVRLKLKNKDFHTIEIDVKKLINNIVLAEMNQIMSPNKDAVFLAETVTKTFSVK